MFHRSLECGVVRVCACSVLNEEDSSLSLQPPPHTINYLGSFQNSPYLNSLPNSGVSDYLVLFLKQKQDIKEFFIVPFFFNFQILQSVIYEQFHQLICAFPIPPLPNEHGCTQNEAFWMIDKWAELF